MGQSASCKHCPGASAAVKDEEVLEVTLHKAESTGSSLQHQVELPRLLGKTDDSRVGDVEKVEKTPAAADGSREADFAEVETSPAAADEEDVAKVKKSPAAAAVAREDKVTEAIEDSARDSPPEVQRPAEQPAQASTHEEAKASAAQAEVRLKKSTANSSAVTKAQRKMERVEARSQIQPWLQQHGFQTVKSKKTFFWRMSYPLHKAAKQNDVEVVQLLLKAGADATKTNWRGQTPQDVAASLDRNGSHAKLLEVFQNKKAQQERAREKKEKRTKGKAKKRTTASTNTMWSQSSACSSGLVRDENGRTNSQALVAAEQGR
eukprot:TRINITY_DN9109_c0_g1_i2.p1 TRINITY_DN9109_c0_g1~~TRINITY_DN9109_c0_g1_i2.p1  ORF type:complete len:343 (-),score=85.73 TRINITY_DN9109_c0_g1_i2:112-1071(-)